MPSSEAYKAPFFDFSYPLKRSNVSPFIHGLFFLEAKTFNVATDIMNHYYCVALYYY